MAISFYANNAIKTTDSDKEILHLPRVSAVIPTLNEANNLPIILPRIPHWISEVVIVDGCSTDRTVEVARELRPDATIVLEKRRGKGAALRAGFHAVTGDITIILDADGSMDPAESIMLVGALMAGADFAKGSRFIQGGGTDDMTWFRMTGNWGLTQAVRLLFGGTYSDLCYGYLAFWTKHRDILEPTCDGFEVETFLNIKALKSGMKIVEVPSFEAPRVFGESNLKPIQDGWRVLKTILRERLPHSQGVA